MMTTEESIAPSRLGFWLAWVVANSIGLGVGWPLAELLGLKVANFFGWGYGELVGFLLCEGFIWATRLTVLSRLRDRKILSALDVFAWLTAEVIGWFAGRLPYDPDSLVGVTSGSILAYDSGVTLWLIFWLIRVEQPARRPASTPPQRFLGSATRVAGSLAVFLFMGIGMPLSVELGYAAAEAYDLIIGRAIAGVILGAVVGAFTGWAMLSLMKREVWKADFAA